MTIPMNGAELDKIIDIIHKAPNRDVAADKIAYRYGITVDEAQEVLNLPVRFNPKTFRLELNLPKETK